jgi:hypothetical protein
MRLSQTAKAIGTFIAILVLAVAGEVLIAGVLAKFAVIPLVKYLDARFDLHLTGSHLLAAEAVVMILLLFVGGVIFGKGAVAVNKTDKPVSWRWLAWVTRKINAFWDLLESKGIKKECWVDPLLRMGKAIGFVLAACIGGAALVGAWFALMHDPRAFRKAVGAAAVLAVVSGVSWIAGYNRRWDLVVYVIVAMVAVSLMVDLVASARSRVIKR